MSPNTTNTTPRPENTRVMLISAGYQMPTFTLHHYFETKAARTRTGSPIWEHVFKCFKTGALRRFGAEERMLEPTEKTSKPVSSEAN